MDWEKQTLTKEDIGAITIKKGGKLTMDSTIQELLGPVPLEEAKDPRCGEYDVTLTAVTLKDGNGYFTANLEFSGPQGKVFNNLGLSTIDNEGWDDAKRAMIRNIRRRWYEALDLKFDGKIPVGDNEENATKIVSMLQTRVGHTVYVEAKENDAGFVNINLRKKKEL